MTCPREKHSRFDQKLNQKNEFTANNVRNPSSIALGYVFEKDLISVEQLMYNDSISTHLLNISCVETIDVATRKMFNMRAMLLWTINDFPTRSSLFGWSGQGYLAYPTSNEGTPSEQDDMVKAESHLIDIWFNIKHIYPPAFFDIMIHSIIHLPEEALKGGTILYRWMYPLEIYMKKLKNYVQNKAKPEGSIAETLKAPRNEESDMIRQHYIDKDPSITDDLFALAYGPSSTLISVSTYVVNGVRLSNGCVIMVEDDHDVIHDNNSSDLALSTSLNDLDFVTLNIDGQSMDVETPPDIIGVDDDDDFINGEDEVPHDLAYFDDEVLASDDDDDVVAIVVYSSDEED
ncbi:reverse transcriptase domain-containing protein [Tanacetum coccineum]